MEDFKEVTEIENVGGCDGFMFTDVNMIDSIPSASGGVLLSAVDLKTGGAFFKGYASQDTLSFKETQSETAQGTLYSTLIKGKYPKPDKDILRLFSQLTQSRTVLTVLDNNGNLRLVGSQDCGCKFKYEETSGGKGSEYNGIQFEFSRQGIAPSYFYAAPDGSPGMEIM